MFFILPDVELTSFRVFDHNAETTTHWYLDSINFAIALGMDVINVSIGGNDSADLPFKEKFQEACAHGIAVFAASGNEGGIGSTLHPANEPCVIGIGAANFEHDVPHFSTKGFTTEFLSQGSGQFKPDLLMYGEKVPSLTLKPEPTCSLQTGTSFASPIACGVGAVVLQVARTRLKNPNGAFVRQVLVESASRLDIPTGIYGQGEKKIILTL